VLDEFRLAEILRFLSCFILWHVNPLLATTAKEAPIQQPLLSNGFAKKIMFARQELETVTEEWRFLCGPCLDVISRAVSDSQSRAAVIEAGDSSGTQRKGNVRR
jgi:hypothetical protein